MMSEPVRVVSDGEELVLWKGEAFRIHSKAEARDPMAAHKTDSAASKRIAVQYLGFHDVQGRREYALDVRRGEQARRYTLWIELAAFSRREALLQDGPDICYQRLLRELADSELQGSDSIGVTAGDLATYREAHARPARKGFSPPSASEASKAPADGPPRRGGGLA